MLSALCGLVCLITVGISVHCGSVVKYKAWKSKWGNYTALYWRCHNIFLSHKEVLESLNYKLHACLPEVKKLFRTYNYHYTRRRKKNKTALPGNVETRMPFIVIEGTEASGTDRIGHKIANKINGKFFSNPPEVFNELLDPFRYGSSKARAAFKAFCNYAVAEDITNCLHTHPAVLDGYFYKHRAYYIARYALFKEYGTLPDYPELYEWPKDLLKPDIIYWIKTSEKTINKRLNITNIHRYCNATINSLRDLAYTRFNGTIIQPINGDDWASTVVINIYKHIRQVFAESNNNTG